MNNRDRDHLLYYLRGFGCLCMVISHSSLADKTDLISTSIEFIASLASVYFFAMTGVTARIQLKYYPLNRVCLSYFGIFLMGFCYSAIIHPDLYRFITVEVFQIIAIGGIFCACLYKWFKPSALMCLVITFSLILINWARLYLLPDFHGAGILFVHETYIPHHELVRRSDKVRPGFPILSWLYIFPLGVLLYDASRRTNGLIAIGFFALFICLEMMGINTDWRNKWEMTPGYTFICISALATSLFLLRSLPKHQPGKNNILTYFGRYSLRFMYLHIFGIGIVSLLKSYNQYLAWIAAIAFTYLVMKAFDKIPEWKVMHNDKAWLVLLAFCITLPLLMLLSPDYTSYVMLGEYLAALIYIKHSHYLMRLTKSSDKAFFLNFNQSKNNN